MLLGLKGKAFQIRDCNWFNPKSVGECFYCFCESLLVGFLCFYHFLCSQLKCFCSIYFVWRKSVHDFCAVVVYCSHLKLQHGLESGSKELVYQQFWSLNGMEGLPQKQKYNRIKADPGKLSLELCIHGSVLRV